MNDREYEAVRALARIEGISTEEAAERYALFGTGELQRRELERDQWNIRVAVQQQAKAERKRGPK